MFIKYGDILLLRIFPSFSFLNPDPITQCSGSCRASHSEHGHLQLLQNHHGLLYNRSGLLCLEGGCNTEFSHSAGEQPWLMGHVITRDHLLKRDGLIGSKSLFRAVCEFMLQQRLQPKTGGMCTGRAWVLLLLSGCFVISGKISPVGKCTKLCKSSFC